MGLSFNVPAMLLSVELLNRQRITAKRLQIAGFLLMAFAYALYGVLDALRVNAWVLFAAYCFLNFTLSFGPNVTTFVLPAATFSGDTKSTMNGLCAALGKLGAVVGTQVLPVLLDLGLSYVLGACLVTCVAGALLTQRMRRGGAYETVLLEADAGEGAWHGTVCSALVSGMGGPSSSRRRGRVEAPVHGSCVAAGSRSLVAAVGGVVQLAPDLHREREERHPLAPHDVPVVEDVAGDKCAGDAVDFDEFLRCPRERCPRDCRGAPDGHGEACRRFERRGRAAFAGRPLAGASRSTPPAIARGPVGARDAHENRARAEGHSSVTTVARPPTSRRRLTSTRRVASEDADAAEAEGQSEAAAAFEASHPSVRRSSPSPKTDSWPSSRRSSGARTRA